MRDTLRLSLVVLAGITVLTGCGYQTTMDESGALIVNRSDGRAFRAYDSVAIELPRVSLDEQNAGRVVRLTTDIAGERFTVTARAKLMNTFLMWDLRIEPKASMEGGSSTARDDGFDARFTALREARRLAWTSITIDLRDTDRFLVQPIEVKLNSTDATNLVDADGDVYGYMFEGTVILGYEALMQIDTLDVRWRL